MKRIQVQLLDVEGRGVFRVLGVIEKGRLLEEMEARYRDGTLEEADS